MNTALFQELQLWFKDLPNNHAQPLKRPVILIPNSLVELNTDSKRFGFINPQGLVQYGLKVNFQDQSYLMLFLQLKNVLPFVEELLHSDFQFDVAMLETEKYFEYSDLYSKGTNEIDIETTL